MPRTGGVYSPPAGTKGVPSTTIQSVPYNAFVDDLTNDANAARPITAGGTGATSASAARSALGLAIGSDVQAYDADLAAIAALTTSSDKLPYSTGASTWALTNFTAFARTLLDDADAATARTTLGAQASDAGLTSIAGLTTAADRMIYTTAADTYAVTTLTAFARTLLDDATDSAALTTLGVSTFMQTVLDDTTAAAAQTTLGVPPNARTITAGNGMTGGGDLSANRTLTLGTPSNITNSTTNSVTTTSHTHALGFTAAEVYAGTGANDTNLSLGHWIWAWTGGASVSRNASAGTNLHDSISSVYVLSGHPNAGTALSGTWRSRGRNGADDQILMQRVA